MLIFDKDSFLKNGREINKIILGRITTMTCFFNIDTNIKISDILEYFSHNNVDFVTLRIPGSKLSKNKQHKPFLNSLSLVYKYDNKRTICCKTFRNGIHMTGCNTFEMCLEVWQLLCSIMKDIFKCDIHIVNYSIQLINIIHDFKKEIDIDTLIRKINEPNITCHYDIERYSGLRVKVDVIKYKCTLLIFPSGKIMITGVKNANDIEIMNTFLLKYIC